MKASATTREYEDVFYGTGDGGPKRRAIVKCWMCMCSFRTGDVVMNLTGTSKGKQAHRACIREILQSSYDEIPAKGHEIVDVSTDGAIEAYRKHLLENGYGKADRAGGQDERDPQGADSQGQETGPGVVSDLPVGL